MNPGDPVLELADLLRRRNEIDGDIASLIGRPAERGHIGEFVAAHIFDIRLADSATSRALDGWFTDGPLAGRSVNVKFYGRHEGLLDASPRGTVDYYLVLCGPRTPAQSSRGTSRPLIVSQVFLLESEGLHDAWEARGVRVGVASSVRRDVWAAAEIYPTRNPRLYDLSHAQLDRLKALGGR